MKVKTYRAATFKLALEEIKRELGPDAFILGQKEIRPSSLLGLVQKSLVEVTAAVDHSVATAPTTTDAPERLAANKEESFSTPVDSRVTATEAVQDRVQLSVPHYREEFKPQSAEESQALLDEIRKLKAMVQSITANRQRTTVWLKPRRFPNPVGKQAYANLVAQGVDEDLAWSLTCSAEVSEEAVIENLIGQVSIYPDFLCNPAVRSPEVVALLGPTGVGKTTTVAKIAALAAFKNKLKVGLVTLDTFRIAAVEQLKTYGEIMGIPVRAVESVKELRSAIQSMADRDLVLIDTAGRNHREVCHEWELAEFMSESVRIRKALVISATTRPSDLRDIIDRYDIFNPNCLIFTKLDETDLHGSILSELIRCGLPLAYVTTGQGVPQDILKPDARQLVDLAVGPERTGTWARLADATRAKHVLTNPQETNPTSRRPGY